MDADTIKQKIIMEYKYVLIFIIMLGVFCFTQNSHAAARIWYEDAENSHSDPYFLLYNYSVTVNSNYPCSTYPAGQLTQSTTHAHRGSNSMRWDVSGINPHAVIGLTSSEASLCSVSGIQYNRGNFDLSSYASRYWLFRWYEYSTDLTRVNGDLVKHIYINYGDSARMYLMLQSGYSTGDTHPGDYLGLDIKYCTDYNGNDCHYVYYNGVADSASTDNDGASVWTKSNHMVDINDSNWHKYDLYLDFGDPSSTTSNGTAILKVDGYTITTVANTPFHQPGVYPDTNPVKFIQTWPGNAPAPASGYLYLDDLEIFTLESLTDVPADPYASGDTDVKAPGAPAGLIVS